MKGIYRVLLIAIVICMAFPVGAMAEDIDLSYLEKIIIEKQSDEVLVTVPSEMYSLDETEFPYELNSDQSATFTLTYEEYAALMDAVRQGIDSALQDMIADESFNLVSIKANENYSAYELVVTNEELHFGQMFGVLGLMIYSSHYMAFDGEVNLPISFTFINQVSGEVIDSFTSDDLAADTST